VARIQDAGCGVGVRVQASGFRIQGSGFRFQGLRFEVSVLGYGVWGVAPLDRAQMLGACGVGLRLRVQGSGFRDWALGCEKPLGSTHMRSCIAFRVHSSEFRGWGLAPFSLQDLEVGSWGGTVGERKHAWSLWLWGTLSGPGFGVHGSGCGV